MTTEPQAGRTRRPGARDLRVVLVFAALNVAASLLGRSTMVADADVSLVWPAAGVSVLWLVARARRPWPWLDPLVLAVSTGAVVAATGASALTAVIGAAAATLQAVVCAWVLARRAPYVWAARGRQQLRRVADLWWFVLGAALSSVVSAPLVELAVVAGGGPWTWLTALLWCARNTVAIVGIGTLGFTLGAWLHRRASRRSVPERLAWWTDGRPADYLAALVLAPVLYVVWFLEIDWLAVVFPLIGLTVWAGSRLPSRSVVLHTTLCGCVAIQLTLAGTGPFSDLPSPTTQVAVAQLYVGLITVIGLALAIARDDRLLLVADLQAARDRAQEQALLLATVVDTMSEGVRVVDAAGRVVVRNPTAGLLLTGRADTGPGDEDLAHLARMDGSALPEAELPFRRALAGEQVRGADLLVRVPGATEPRIVTFSATPLPAASGGGAVTVLRDVTAERTELRRAAQVQASLLPARGLDVPGLDLAARFVPAGSVGGDFYDWQAVADGLVLTLADVMGKGPAAAILAATTRSVLHAQASLQDVAGTLAATERAMTADLANAGAFVTMFRAYVDAVDGSVSYTDAGHGLSLIVGADGAARRLSATGLPLGIALGPARVSARTQLDPGEVLVTFSDGILDALGGSMTDLDQVGRALRGTDTAEEAAEAVLQLVDPRHPEDDLTVVALRRAA